MGAVTHQSNGFQIEIDARPQDGLRRFHATLHRVNVLFGVNGCGKSRLLAEISRSLVEREASVRSLWDRFSIFLNGQRYSKVPSDSSLAHYPTLQSAEVNFNQTRASYSPERLVAGFAKLRLIAKEDLERWGNETQAWEAAGEIGPRPRRSEAPLDRLSAILTRILPHLRLIHDPRTEGLTCNRYGASYPLGDISDGEKQIVGALVEVFMLANDAPVIIVDEPESHLHPDLACRFWNEVEKEFPDATFLYSTHSLNFAVRPEVAKIFIFDLRFEDEPREFSPQNVAGLSHIELKDFLGAIPGIVTTRKALIVEGDKSSLDKRFYRWLLPDPEIQIFEFNGSTSVEKAARGTDVWEGIARHTRVVGIVDRDYRSVDEVAKLESAGCEITDLQEAESYFCIPQLLASLSDAVNPKTIEQEIISIAQRSMLDTAKTRTVRRFRRTVNPTGGDDITDRAQLRDALAKSVVEMAKDICDEHEKVKKFFDEECDRIENAIHSANVEELLKLIPGRSCLAALGAITGLGTTEKVIHSVLNSCTPDSYPLLVSLRQKILKRFAQPVA